MTPIAARRIRDARRAALRNRLIDADRLLPAEADRWISEWAERVGEPESAAEFDACYEWVVSELGRPQSRRMT